MCGNRHRPQHVLLLGQAVQDHRDGAGTLVTPQEFVALQRKVKRQDEIIQILKNVNCTVSLPLKDKLEALELLYGQFSIHILCEALEVSRGTFYNHILRNKRTDTWYTRRRAEIGENVREIYEENRQIFGADKICAILIQQGERVSKRFVTSIMQEVGLVSMSPAAKKDHNRLTGSIPKKNIAALKGRDRELDTLFERLYEDNVAGKINDERFARMSIKYEEEQKEAADKIKALQSALDKSAGKAVTAEMFLSTVRKYTRSKKLTPRMLNELIQFIEVHQAEMVNGTWEQRLTIHYNCIGVIDIPEELSIPYPNVTVNTRKGVFVSYAPNTPAG